MSSSQPPGAPIMSQTPLSSHASQPTKSQRILSCLLCQQRKVKCDRQQPCSNCLKSRVQCVSASQLQRPRRRRFPEKALLEKLRTYEGLLRKNGIGFEPLHGEGGDGCADEPEADDADEIVDEKLLVKSEKGVEVKNFWHAMRQMMRELDTDSNNPFSDLNETVLKKAWDGSNLNDSLLLFGTSHPAATDLSSLHPEPVQIFRLWQIFLDNVNPLLRVIHAPTMQARIIEAVSDLKNITPSMEALLFSIYCSAEASLLEESPTAFSASREARLSKYQIGAQRALANAGFLRTSERDCLTALYLYLISVFQQTDPRALSSVVGLAIRIAQRMRIDNEASCAKSGILEGEMRRRLWWALVLFDTRVGQLAGSNIHTIHPPGGCRIPLNANDTDLRPEMKDAPPQHNQPTEAIFAVVRSELDEYTRRWTIELSQSTAKDTKPTTTISPSAKLTHLSQTIEEKYLRHYHLSNPLHFMTIYSTRAYIAKYQLLAHYSGSFTPSSLLTASNQSPNSASSAIPHALTMLESDTQIMTSTLTKGYRWMTHYHFPFPAYIYLIKELRRQPDIDNADQIWNTIGQNYEARAFSTFRKIGPFLNLFTRLVMGAWWARESFCVREGVVGVEVPRIVGLLRETQREIGMRDEEVGDGDYGVGGSGGDFLLPVPLELGGNGFLPGGNGWGGSMGGYHDFAGQMALDFDLASLDWGCGDGWRI